ncbi:MAG TPA: DoxX family protein [Longimicrobiales bacterium]|nr:DoxX family protein [Longimicrobiales bacterium]
MFAATDQQRRYALTILRIGLGIVFIAHGYQKLFVMHPAGVAGFFGNMGIPVPLVNAWLVSILEFFGGILLIAGAATRLVALGLAIDMIVATLLVHLPNGFFMGEKPGVEFTMLLAIGALALVVGGPGSPSIDELRNKSTESAA